VTGTETNLQVPAAAVVVFTAGASGSKIEEVVAEATQTTLAATTVAGLIYLFLYDGTTHHLFDSITVTATTASATAAPFRASNRYSNLILANGWSLRASNSIAGNAGLIKVTALGADF
jgi:hypothetical protein